MASLDPIPDIERLGYTRREAGFLALVAMHSGYFLRRQFNCYLNKEDGGLAESFLSKAQAKHHVRVLSLLQRRFIFHVCSRTLYRLCGAQDSQNRRTKGDRAMKTALLSLDYVLDHPAQMFLRTRRQKLEYFRDTLHIPSENLPSVVLASPSECTRTVYFPYAFPISVLARDSGRPPTISLCFVDDGIETTGPFHRFLLRHEQLIRSLRDSEVVYVSESRRHFHDTGRVLSKMFPKLATGTVAARECPLGVDHLIEFLEAREAFEDDHTRPGLEEAKTLTEGRAIYNTNFHQQLFDSWMEGDTTEEEIRYRFAEKSINVSIRGYVIRAAFPQNGPKYKGVE